jgi:hypothetical protein
MKNEKFLSEKENDLIENENFHALDDTKSLVNL